MSNPVVYFIRENLNSYVLIAIIILFIYFGYLRKKYQKESFESYFRERDNTLSNPYRRAKDTEDKVSKSIKKNLLKNIKVN